MNNAIEAYNFTLERIQARFFLLFFFWKETNQNTTSYCKHKSRTSLDKYVPSFVWTQIN